MQSRRPDDGRVFLRWLPLVLIGVIMAGATGRPNPIIRPVLPDQPARPRSEYEGGRPRHASGRRERYKARPSIHRLLRDVRRPAARSDALEVLMRRVADTDLRAWVSDRIAGDELNRLAMFARPETPDDVVLAAWRMELARDRRDNVAATEDERVQAHFRKALAAVVADGDMTRWSRKPM